MLEENEELEFIEKEIENAQRWHNTYAIKQLQSIKDKLQAFEIMKNKVIIRADNNELTITNGLKNNTIIKLITNEEQETLVKAFKEEKKNE